MGERFGLERNGLGTLICDIIYSCETWGIISSEDFTFFQTTPHLNYEPSSVSAYLLYIDRTM